MDTKAFIEKTRREPVTDEDLEQIKSWAAEADQNAIIAFMQEWTSTAKPVTSAFSSNYKRVNAVILPFFVKTFEVTVENK